MKKIILLFVITFILSSCKNENVTPPDTTTSQTDVNIDEIFKTTEGEILSKSPQFTPAKSLKTKGASDLTVLETAKTENCTYPTQIAGLIGGAGLKIYKFDRNSSASASAMGFSGEIGRKEMLFIQDYLRYGFITCDGVRKKVGIGLRCFIHVKSIRGKAGYNKLPGIAANVELGNAQCSYELQSIGFAIDGSVLAEGLNPQGDYNVENFGKLAVTFNNVLKKLDASNTMPIDPVDLP